MDAVYILGNGSQANDEELRYSIRSLAKNMLDLQNVWVVGDKPRCDLSIRHIPCNDSYKERWKNCLNKVQIACREPEISADFLFMYDDVFALEPFYGAELPFYTRKGRDGGISGPKSFETHRPIRFNKDAFLKIPLTLDMKGDYKPRSFYCNFYGATGPEVDNGLIVTGKNVPPYEDQIKGREFFSILDAGMLEPSLFQFLFDLYPERCDFEN